MLTVRGLLTALSLGASLALAQDPSSFDWTTITASNTLNWVSCYDPPFECARFNVPLNYKKPKAGTAAIALLRLPTTVDRTSTAYKGPVLFNPGGPGGSGVDTVFWLGGAIQGVIGTNYDLIGFDPRGIARSTPKIELFASQAEREYFNLGPDARDMEEISMSTLPARWAKMQELGEVAEENIGHLIKHMTTDNIARDMLKITQAHGREKLLYWGISYGTVIGATFASMFPNKIDRMMLDGNEDVVNAYYSLDWRVHVQDADKAIQAFFDECAAAPACAIHEPTAAAVKTRFDAILASVAATPVPVPGGGTLTLVALKSAVLTATYEPVAYFSLLAQGLRALELGDPAPIYSFVEVNGDGVEQAVVCTDGHKVTDTPEDLEEYAEEIEPYSSYFSSFVASFRLFCSGWKVHPKNFDGPIGGQTSHPIFFVGNTADSVTPLGAAFTMSAAFPGSEVLTYNIPGHTSFAYPSPCVMGHTNAYFQQGVLPAPGTICDDVEIDYFPSGVQASTAAEVKEKRRVPLNPKMIWASL